MTNSSPVRMATFVSPFLLPYIQADREDLDKRTRTAIEEHSPNGTIMLSPMEDHPGRESFLSSRTEIYNTAPASPQRLGTNRSSITPPSKFSADSPAANRRSMIEKSISELTFDPDLTFMDSPGRSSALSDQSPTREFEPDIVNETLPPFTSPMKTVSPDRSVVPLDESEIGFSNELRARSGALPQELPIEEQSVTAPERSGKRRKVITETGNVAAVAADMAEKSPTKATRAKRTTTKTESAPSKLLASGTEDESAAASIPGPTILSTRKRKTNDEVNQKVSKELVKPETQSSATSTKKPASKVTDSARKSPRFASKVITSQADVPPLMLCPNCKKAYKRARDYEKHVASCK